MGSRRVLLAGGLAAVLCALATPAAHAQTDFFTSFEADEPAPTWSDTAETDAEGNKKMSGVTGSSTPGIPGNIRDKVVAVTASAENPPSETAERVNDGDLNSKWLAFEPTGWLRYELSEPVAVVHYALSSANDEPGRDPRDWQLQGSHDGSTWTTLDTQTGQDFSERFQTKEYRFDNEEAFEFYRLNITANHGDGLTQLAELQLSDGDTTPPPPTDMKAFATAGPVNGPTMKPNAGWTGLQALRYSGGHTAEGRGYAYNKVFDVDIDVTGDSELSYLIFPELTNNDLGYPSTYASVDLAFTDGTYLSDLDAIDQQEYALDPQGQGASKSLYANQWNRKLSRIGAVAAGKTIDRILVGYDNPQGTHLFNGWIDDIRIDGSPEQETHARPSDWVLTTRGTNSTGSFSRGNNIPATAVPHGFNFWTPMTDAGSLSWLYAYQQDNNDDNLPEIEAFAASHEPSPWMGDRQTFQVMPSPAADVPDANRDRRGLAFRHENEIAKPYRYGVEFENGMRTDVAPTDHAALFRFEFTGDSGNVILDNVNGNSGLTINQAEGTISGWSDVRSGLSNGASRLFVYGTFDRPVTQSGMLPAGNRPSTGYVKFDTSAEKVVNLRIATSLMSLEQARKNLQLEIEPADTLTTLAGKAQDRWDEKLGVVEVEGATPDQSRTLYSNLYRLSLYPNSAHENVGSAASPQWKHAVQSSTDSPPATPTETGAEIADGKVYVNNGFWDTYRTVWSGYALFDPGTAGEMVDGFVQQYRDGGWVSRWSSPGYANLMTGTSSDVSFADAYVKGVKGFDARAAYDAALKNATVAPPGDDPNDTSVGRKGLQTSLFLGYTPSAVSEGVSWALEGYINDFGIGNMAKALADRATDKQRLKEESEYFLSRATNYVNMFDPAIGFFQGRSASGRWKSSPDDYDPRVWGHDHDYTETDGWNFAFHAPQDGQGLANLYGGQAALGRKLDTFFTTPETAGFPGSYGGTIHEMLEARDVRMGQWGFSNQVSHHIPWMYAYAKQPWKTAEKVREVLRRMYAGSEIGQGYAGDEDNGETSAWYLFAAMGFYPLQVGSPNYAIGSPLFKKATIHRPGGDIVVRAPQNSARNVYVQGLQVDGRSWDKTYLPHSVLADGAQLTFDMGPRPSGWATRGDSAPPSLTGGSKPPRPLRDATGKHGGVATSSSGGDVAKLFDDTSGTEAQTGEWVEYAFAGDARRDARFYTLTSGESSATEDPLSWTLKGSNDDGVSWAVLDQRSGETFRWRSQTRPFKVARPGQYERYRLEVTANGGGAKTTLAEIELLNHDEAVPLGTEVASSALWAGSSVPVRVDVWNSGGSSFSGDVSLTVPEGWTVSPATRSFGPLATGGSQTLTFDVTVPAGVSPGEYDVTATATAGSLVARGTGTVHVLGNTIEFTPGTSAEEPWLADADGSQLDGAAYDGRARFTDNQRYFVYRFELPGDVTGGTLSLDIGNQFLVQSSTDGSSWTTVLREDRQIRDLSNRAWRDLDLNTLRGGGRTVYLRVADSFTSDGWGAWVARTKLVLQR
jgi:predicted alpha-1,2-mannosidase